MKHGDEVVVPSATTNTSNLGIARHTDGLVDHTGIVVQPTGQAEIEADEFEFSHRLKVLEKDSQILHGLQGALVVAKLFRFHQSLVHCPRFALLQYELADFVGHFGLEALVFGHFTLHFLPRLLIELIDGTANGAEFVGGNAAEVQNGIQESSVVELDAKVSDGKCIENIAGNADAFGIGDHPSVRSGNVEIALVKLTIPALGQLGLIATINLADVESLDVAYRVEGEESRKGHRQIVPEGQ